MGTSTIGRQRALTMISRAILYPIGFRPAVLARSSVARRMQKKPAIGSRAGVNGLASLYHLLRLGCRRAALIERFSLGHERGSSHGYSRVTRSAYIHAGYVRLVQAALREEWPRLECEAGMRLIHHTPGCFFGPAGGKWEQYARAATEAGLDAEVLDPAEARRRFPLFRFEGAAGVLEDRTAGLVAARDTMSALVRLCRERGGSFLEQTRVISIEPGPELIRVVTERGEVTAQRLVVAAGPWASELLPTLKPQLKIARQTVGYFRLSGDQEQYGVGRFPVWGDLGEESEGGVFYGLPQFGREGIKIARHITVGVGDDPELVPGEPPEGEIDRLRSYLEEQFTPSVERLVGWETCLYTNRATEDFIIDLHPDDPRIAVAAGFSGHGFKFGPLTGRLLAELAMEGKTTVAEFEAMRGEFSFG